MSFALVVIAALAVVAVGYRIYLGVELGGRQVRPADRSRVAPEA